MKNKVVSVILVIMLLFSTMTVVNAESENDSQGNILAVKVASLNNEDIEVSFVQKIIDLYNASGLIVSDIDITDNNIVISLSDDSDVSVVNTNPGTTVFSKITVVEANRDNTKIIIEENGRKDILNYSSDGPIFLNENEVNLISEYQAIASDSVTTRGVHYITYTCPYGSASDYSDFRKTIAKNNIDCKKKIAKLTSTALITVVTTALGANYAIKAARAKNIIQVAADNGSNSTYISLKRSVYWHKNGYVVNGKGIEKWVTKYYYKKDYAGSAGSDTRYEVYG